MAKTIAGHVKHELYCLCMRTRTRFIRLSFSSLALVVAVAFAAAPAVNAATGAKPYFKVYGGSVFSGGGFNTSASGATCSTNYQYSAPGSASTAGGVYTYAKSASNNYGGASSQYDAYALGSIDGNSGNAYGFYTSSVSAPTTQNVLTFANTATTAWGGYFDGSVPQTQCIPDYYDLYAPNAATPGFNFSTGTSSGLYKVSGNPYHLNNGNVQIQSGNNITIFVTGSVYIDKNITYNYDKDTNMPKFALVVKGNIYVDPSVTQLDGLYVAQPTSANATDGVLWTCHDNSTNTAPISVWFSQNCGSKLTINGAVAARQINFMRVNGDVASGAAISNEASSSGNISEVINYTPAMIVGGGFFDQAPSSYKVESVTSLPPVF